MITLLYSCQACGLVDRPIQVPARTTEDVCDWVGTICAQAIGDDHHTVSPACQSRTMTNLKIPVPSGTEFIGQQIE